METLRSGLPLDVETCFGEDDCVLLGVLRDKRGRIVEKIYVVAVGVAAGAYCGKYRAL